MRLGSTLDIKLLRDLWRLRGQAVAIALVIAAGVGTVVMAVGLIGSLETSRSAYYDRYRFADVFAPLVRAPEPMIARVRALPDVAAADSRVSTRATLDVAQVAEPVSARVHSLPEARGDALNQLVLRSGRFPDPRHPEEVVANEAFVQAAGLSAGDRITAVLYGKQVALRLVGTVLSPEYVYAIGGGQVFPDNRRFAILWMGREPLAAALDLNQAFNDVLVRLSPGAKPEEVERHLDLLLAPYGGIGAYDREQQISDRFIASEIDQLKTMAGVLPPVFLLVAAFLLNIVLARLVETEREIIGLLKAFGFPGRAILLHYVELALLLSLGGLALGIGLGTWLGRALAGLYQRFYSFPFLAFDADADVYWIAAAATLVPVALGAATAVWRAARLTPAEAMRPPAPSDYSGRVGRWIAGIGPDEPTRIVLRGLLRRPVRSLLSVIGLGAALSLYIVSQASPGSIERMIEIGFGSADRSDLLVLFAERRDERALHELQRIPGVLGVQPLRATDARLVAGPRKTREGISGVDAGGELNRVVDVEGKVLDPPPRGVMLTGQMASELGVGRGDAIEARVTEGERPVLRLVVTDVLDAPFGSSATIDRALLNRLMREGNTLSGAYLKVDTAALPRIYSRLKDSPMVAGITVKAAALHSIRATVQENFNTMTIFYTGLSVLVVMGVAYNSARISLSERARDLASLRVLGFRRGEVAFVLLGEQALLVILSLPIGILGGMALWRFLVTQFSSDLFTIPYFIDPRVFGQGALVIAAAAGITALIIRRRVDRLDLVRALKTRE
ncbi:FtsX-like permease family protein [Sphingomonas cannabina]|uniref:ABC transporter permease n=1 Tax=Sphingomonas cannabina TaxID=2899123 RepID=UPI001F4554A6|nr:FtsX-like permease family protein [Sphingomonas cannabina]UIJ47334.1 FtsX-like permease family protein [Sphingomonas cannabina]